MKITINKFALSILLVLGFMLLSSNTLLSAAAAVPEQPDLPPITGRVDPYKTRTELLMDATYYTGVFTPEQAARVWAEGLKGRSAALQYTVMTDKLKEEYSNKLNELNSNWVTGESSPWVQDYKITKTKKPDASHAEISMRFETISSATPPEYYNAKLWIVKVGEFWRIERIESDNELMVYRY